MEAVIFCRVSSRDQEETGYSLPAQEKFLLDYSQRKSLRIVKIISTAESASRKKRRQVFNAMLDYVVKENIHIIVCEKIDRFTRSHKDAVLIDKWLMADKANEVHFVKNYCVLNQETKASERFMWNIHVSKAEYDLDNLSEEVKKGQIEKLESGWKPSRPPLGYKSVNDNGRLIQVFDDKTAGMVKRMLNLYASGNYSVKRLCELMYEEGLRSKKGKKVSASRIHGYLTNPYYVGLIPWNGNLYKGKHEPLIDYTIYQKIKELLKGKDTPKVSKHNYAFKALIRCKECTGIITWESHKDINYGHCNHYRNCKQIVWVKEKDVIKQIVPALKKLLVKNEKMRGWIYHALLERQSSNFQHDKKVQNSLLIDLERTGTKLNNLVDMRSGNEVDSQTYLQKRREYLDEKSKIEASLLRYSKSDETASDLESKIYVVAQKAHVIFKGLVPERKRSLLRMLFSSFTLDQGKINFEFSKGFKLLVRLVELTNSSKMTKSIKSEDSIFEPDKYPVQTFQNPLFLPAYSALRR